MPAKPPSSLKTIDVLPDRGVIIKPGELIDVVEMSPLTLTDRRIYNLLLSHAWEQIERAMTHVIDKKALRGSRDANDRVGESVERLMAAIARLEIERDGKRYIRRVQLLGATDEGRENDGLLYYRFPPELRTIIRKSNIFARLRTEVIFHLTSKYSLALYEIIQKRGNMTWKKNEELDLDRFRQMLGVEAGKLPAFSSLNQKAIKPALAEVNRLSDFVCKVKPVEVNRKVVKIKLSWEQKSNDELRETWRELEGSKVGRKARLKGTVEQVVPPLPMIADAAPGLPAPAAQETQADDLRKIRLLMTIAPREQWEHYFAELCTKLEQHGDENMNKLDIIFPSGAVISYTPDPPTSRCSELRPVLEEELRKLLDD